MNTTWQSAPIDAATSSPLRPGIRTSRNATCGAWMSNSASASSPSAASATIVHDGHNSASFSLRRSRINGSSSAIIAVAVVMLRVSSGGSFARVACGHRSRRIVARQHDARDESTGYVFAELERRRASVEQMQPLADIGEADALPRLRNASAQPRTGVGHAHDERCPFMPRADVDAPAGGRIDISARHEGASLVVRCLLYT